MHSTSANKKLYDDEGSCHFFEWDIELKVIGAPIWIDNRTREALEVAEWYMAQHQVDKTTACGSPGWFGVNKARASDSPTKLIQFTVPVLASAGAS